MKLNIERVPEAELDTPRIPEAAAPATTAQIGAVVAMPNILPVSQAEDATSLDDISDEGETRFEPFTLTHKGGKQTCVYIKELDVMSLLDIEAGKLLVKGREVVRAPARESKLGMALEVVASVHKRVELRSGEATFEPFFADTGAAQEWMKRSSNKALISQVLSGIYVVNPELSPQKKMQALNSQT